MTSTPPCDGPADKADKGSNSTLTQPTTGAAAAEPQATTAEWKAFSDQLFTGMLDMPPIPLPEHMRANAYARGGGQAVAEQEAEFSAIQEKHKNQMAAIPFAVSVAKTRAMAERNSTK
ncbi:hypothetical protein LTR27_011466 [Elasticomyces elasticus]|nr:hypothetical protein LTR27_011466 [Elasticomyces elasticus]